jgi:CBS domain containing-hemolysin-like protein
MSDSHATARSAEPASPAGEHRNLPVPVSRPTDMSPEVEGFFSRLVRALFGWRSGPTRADIEVALEAAVPGETGVSPTERTMLQNILALRERRIEDVMVPRADIVAVQQDIQLGELMKVFRVAAHSRLVVYNDTLDDPVGMVHIRDLLAFVTTRADASAETLAKRKKPLPAGLELRAVDLSVPLLAAKIVREILFVPPSMPALDLLTKMQATHIHLALVVDEYGGTDGLVSMEDIVEQIVGEISDEHDDDTPPAIVRQPDGAFVADARATLDAVTTAVGPEFDVGDADKEVDTLGGYLMAQGGRLPLRGELIAGPAGFEFEVLDADPRRVKKVKIYRTKNRPQERDRDGRRRYGAPETITLAPLPASDGEEQSQLSTEATSPKTPPAS